MAVKPREGSAASAVRIALGSELKPAQAALLVRDDPFPFALIGRWAGGGAVIGSAPVRIASGAEDPFDLLDEQPLVATPNPCIVGGGWFGWLGYQLGRRIEPIDPSPPAAAGRAPPVDRTPFQLAYYDHVLHLTHDGQWWFEALWSEPRAEALRLRLAELRMRAAHPPRRRTFSTGRWRITPTAAGHGLAVGACRERIRAGDLFQANICARLQSRISGEPIDLFAAALDRLRPDRAAFIGGQGEAVASLSPELFLERHGRAVRSAPIKGTRAKPSDPEMVAAAREELLGSHKDRAENVMIVDLVRNDLGRVCEPGSVHVDTLADARAHAGVWHLVSEVSGVLRNGVGDAGLVRAAFPPGSVSGTPKIAAMNVIAELESTARELYTGAIGFASPTAGLELSVAIRTFEFRGERVWLGVGGGIVADSDPVAEAAECMIKAAPLLDAIGAAHRGTPATPDAATSDPATPAPRRIGPRPIARPDPSAGVFETMLVRDDRPVALAQHLRRLSDSVAALYRAELHRAEPHRAELAPGLEQELLAAAWGHEAARLRLDARPSGGRIRTEITLSQVPDRGVPVVLCPVCLAGGLGAHKWIDRGLLGALSENVEDEPLLCDLDGLVLEGARGNVFLVESGGLVLTPPADGRILPGVARASVIKLGRSLGLEVRQEPVALSRLQRAQELFVTNALRGVQPAVLAGMPSPAGDGMITSRLAAAWEARLAADRPSAARLTA